MMDDDQAYGDLEPDDDGKDWIDYYHESLKKLEESEDEE